MSLYSSSPKVFIAGNAKNETMRALLEAPWLEVYRADATSDDPKRLSVQRLDKDAAEKSDKEISAPPSGAVVILKAENGAAPAEIMTQLWSDAGLESPEILDSQSTDFSNAQVFSSLAATLERELRNACRRNVDLRGQIAVLREEVEQANIQITDIQEILTSSYRGAHALLWSSQADAGFISLLPGHRISQKLPLDIHPWRLGAVGLMVSSPAEATLDVRLIAREDDAVVAEWKQRFSAGVSWLLLQLKKRIPNRYQMIHIEVSNDAGGAQGVELGVGRALHPDETILIDESHIHQSLALKLWGGGSIQRNKDKSIAAAANPIFENLSGKLLDDMELNWTANVKPITRLSEPLNWLERTDSQLHIQPAVGQANAAGVDLQPDRPVAGVVIDCTVSEQDAQIVQCCLAAVDSNRDPAPLDQITKLAEMSESVAEQNGISATRWLPVMPGSMLRCIPLTFESPRENFKLIFMTRIAGNSQIENRACFENLRYIIATEKNDG